MAEWGSFGNCTTLGDVKPTGQAARSGPARDDRLRVGLGRVPGWEAKQWTYMCLDTAWLV